jgi:hypothetical protein
VKDSNLSWCYGLRFTNGFYGRGEIGMKVFQKKVSDSERVGLTHDLFKFFTPKIPCESNCPYMVVTDTLNCRKEFEGLVDMEEVRGIGKCPFWPPRKTQQ